MRREELAVEVYNNTPLFLAAGKVTIRDLQTREIPLVLTPAQALMDKMIAEQRAKGMPGRLRMLKARRVSGSVGACLLAWKYLAFNDGANGICVSYEAPALHTLYNYFQQFRESYDGASTGMRQLAIKKPTTMDEKITWEGDGWCDFRSAGNRNAAPGRGASYRVLIQDEKAFWPESNAAELSAALLNTVPEDPDTLIIDVSTAHGIGGAFYEDWMALSDPYTRGDWRGLFFAWHMHPAYRRRVEDPAKFQASLTDIEHTEQRQYGLSLEQLNWRRWAIREKCRRDPRIFKQEYPGNPEEAFLVQGKSRFDQTLISLYIPAKDAPRGRLERVRRGTHEVPTFIPRRDGEGPLTIYRPPSKSADPHYVIGIDVAEGIEATPGGASTDRDFSVACVLDSRTGEQCAVWADRVPPAAFAQQVYDLAWLYHWAFLCPEANGPGAALIYELRREELNYPAMLIYSRERTPDSLEPKTTQELGFKTTSVTRPVLISAVDSAIIARSIEIYDQETLNELRRFVYHDGREEAMVGYHDDRVFALGTAIMGLQQAAMVFAHLERRRRKNAASHQRAEHETEYVREWGGYFE